MGKGKERKPPGLGEQEEKERRKENNPESGCASPLAENNGLDQHLEAHH